MPTTVTNEFGSKVLEYTWEEYQQRLKQRKPLKADTDLNDKDLVVKHTWGLGDILYSTAALRGLKLKYPRCRIHYICTNPDILENNPDVEKIYHFMEFGSLLELGDSLLKEGKGDWYWLDYDVPLKGGYDYKIHLRTKPQLNEFMRSLLLKNPKDLSGDEREFVNQASSTVITRYKMIALDMYCKHAFVDPPEKSVYYYPYDHELEVARKFMQNARDKGYKVITLLPHASTNFKDYPHWRDVIRLCPPKYFWLVLDNWARGSTWAGPNIQDCTGLFRTRPAQAMVIEADLCCSSDTGFLYPRAARNRPCVVTYGPHEPEPFLHYFPSAHGLRVPMLQKTEGMIGMCSVGCYIDTTSCHQKDRIAPCLMELSPETVAGKVMELLGE
jgi:ADP-heptose:LPS heptosyltransferase